MTLDAAGAINQKMILKNTRVKGASGAQREALRAALSLFKTFQGNQSLLNTFEDF